MTTCEKVFGLTPAKYCEQHKNHLGSIRMQLIANAAKDRKYLSVFCEIQDYLKKHNNKQKVK